MLDRLRERLEEVMNSIKDQDTLEKYNLIKNILSYDNCFISMDIDTAMSILKDLNFNDEMSKEIYLELLKEGYGWNIQAS